MSFISVDASTKSIAFAIFDGELRAWGKVIFNHSSTNIYDKAGVIGKKSGALTQALIDKFGVKKMVIEKPVFANSPATASALALGQGALVGSAIFGGIEEVKGVEPITWAAHIGNANLKKAEKDLIRSNNPDASPNKLKVLQREFRKQRTINYVNKRFDLSLDDDDVADAIGVGCWALDKGMFDK